MNGILRVLFVSRNNKTKPFINWAVQSLFTMQMGSKEQKEKLASDILGVNAKVVKDVFNCDSNTLPCIYLFTLGSVKDLRTSLNISEQYQDDDIVAKYGKTDNLARRTKEHITHYKKIGVNKLKLKYYSYIDPQYSYQAETDIRDFMKCLNMTYKYESESELVIISSEKLKLVSDHYSYVSKKYIGHISELVTKIKDLEDFIEKAELKHNLEVEILKSEKKDITYKYEKDVLVAEMTIKELTLRYELLQKEFEINKLLKQ